MRRRIGLEWRIGALLSALVAALVVAAIGAVWLRMQALAHPALEGAVLRASDQVAESLASRLERLEMVTRLLANDPPFRAYVAEGDAPSILDNLEDRLRLYDCDAIVIADARGEAIADTRRRAAPRGPPPPLLAAALEGSPAQGIWTGPEGELDLAAAAPFAAGAAAAIVVLEALDSALAAELRRTTGAEVIFYSGPTQALRTGASTLSLSPSQLDRLLAGAGVVSTNVPGRLDVEGEEFVVKATPLLGGQAQAGVGFVTLRSVDRELAAFRKIQAVLLIVGGVAIPLALALGVLFARRITRPLGVLVRATERVRAGDFAAPLPPDTGDEVGALASAFQAMVAQLKEKEEMDAWIGALASRAAAEGASTLSQDPGPETDSRAPTAVSAPTLAAPQSIGPGVVLEHRFRVLARVGAGGMGTVWRARDEELGEIVAIKVLPRDVVAAHPERVERFRQEIRLARRVTHRNVLRTHELLELAGHWAIVMEHVDGVSLDRLLAQGRLPLSAALRIARQICDGLEAAHAQGIVHRDLKPANVLVDSGGTVKIADFGIARAADAADGLTRDGDVLGTPRYMSPEQAQGRPASVRSDVYSAGVLFYEMLCGRRPFPDGPLVVLLRAHAEAEPPHPTSLNPALGVALAAVLMKALAKDPGARQGSARELSEALASAAPAGSPA